MTRDEDAPYRGIIAAISGPRPKCAEHMRKLKLNKLKRADKENELRRAAYAAMTEQQKEERRRKERERRFANRLKISAQRREKYRTDPAHRAKVQAWNAAYKAKTKNKETT